MTFLWLVAVAEFCIALRFYRLVRKQDREIIELSQAIAAQDDTIDELTSDDSDAEHYRWRQQTLGTILNNTETLMSSFDDLKAAQVATDAAVATIKADVEALLAKLAAIPAAGMTADQQAALDAAVAHANAINAAILGADGEVHPAPAAAPVAAPAADPAPAA